MSLLSRLFGGGAPSGKTNEPAHIEYEGFRITPEPMKEAQGYRLCAVIEKDVNGVAKTHRLIRADTIAGFDECASASIAKAKQMIDQMGDRLF